MARHLEYVEQRVLPHLQGIAERGEYKADFSTPGYNIAIVRDLLRQSGFTVDIFDYADTHYLVVRW